MLEETQLFPCELRAARPRTGHALVALPVWAYLELLQRYQTASILFGVSLALRSLGNFTKDPSFELILMQRN